MEEKLIIIYLRTSTEEQNPENQLQDCISINSFGEYEVIEEKISGWKDIRREGFKELRLLIKHRKVSHLICWDLDRLYRNRKKLIEFFEYCRLYGCKIHSFRQDWLESINKIPPPWNEIIHDLMLQIMGWLAQEESDKKSKRVKAAMRHTPNGAYSYKGKKWGRKELSTQAINKILELRQQGKSMRNICKEVQYADRNNKMKNVSIGVVHKVLSGQHRKILVNKQDS